MEPDGVAGRQTLLEAAPMGLELFEQPVNDNTSSNFPPQPDFAPLLTTTQREATYGHALSEQDTSRHNTACGWGYVS